MSCFVQEVQHRLHGGLRPVLITNCYLLYYFIALVKDLLVPDEHASMNMPRLCMMNMPRPCLMNMNFAVPNKVVPVKDLSCA